jgi:iron uptake system EfeUOB component EfeO/EfeM
MHRKIAKLALPAMAVFALSACTTIEERGLPKCSGTDRRPLNADLWDSAAPAQTSGSDISSALKPYSSIETDKPASVQAIETATAASPSRWNVAASEKPCGEGA